MQKKFDKKSFGKKNSGEKKLENCDINKIKFRLNGTPEFWYVKGKKKEIFEGKKK